MSRPQRWVRTGCFSILTCVSMFAFAQDRQADRTPDSAAIESFAGKALAQFPGEGDSGAVAVSDRILDGFEAGPTRLVVGKGVTIYWGFKFQEGNLQSVAIYDNGHPRLLAAVDNVPALIGERTSLTTMEQYRKAVERNGTAPAVEVFVRDARDLVSYLPYLKRWLQADLLGFNANCSKAGMAPTCTLAEQVDLPVRVHLLPKAGPSTTALPAPNVAAARIPLESFVQ